MIFSSNKTKSIFGVFVAMGVLVSCGENRAPQRASGNNATFYVNEMKASFTTVGEPNAQGKQYKKLVTLEACIKDVAQTNTVSSVPFDIEAGNAVSKKTSDMRGCLNWYELIEYDPNGEVKDIFMTRNLTATERHSGSEEVVLTVNPYKDTFDFKRHAVGAELPTASPVTYMLSSGQKSKSESYNYDIYVKVSEDVNGILSPIRRQAELTTLKLDYRNIDYLNIGVDSALNLTFPYTYKTSLAMDLIRQDLGNITSEKIKRGNFMFNLVFLKETNKVVDPKTSDVVAAVQWTAKPRGDAGLIEVPVTINFANIPALNSRMNVLLTITSLDTPALFADQSYDGVVNGISANSNLEIYLIPNENSARDLYTRYQDEKAAQPSKKLVAQQVIESEGFSEIKNTTNVKFRSKKTLFGAETESEVNLAKVVEDLQENGELTSLEGKAICTAFFEDKDPSDRLVKACMSSPNGMLNAEIRDFIVSVDSKPKNISFGRLETMKITADFSLTNDKIRNQGWGVEGKIGGSADASFNGMRNSCNTPYACGGTIDPTQSKIGQGRKTGLGLGASIGIGGKAYAGYDAVRMQKDSKGVSISSTEEVTSQPIAMSLDVTTRKCLLVVANALLVDKNTDVLPKSKYFCLKSTRSQLYTEYFFLLNHKLVGDNSAVADVHSAVVNPLRMLVRGQKQYNYLRNILSNETGRFNILLSVPDDSFTQDPTNFMAQEAPLMLTTSRRPVLGPILNSK